MNSIVGPVNSAWIVHFVSCTVNSCDFTVHAKKKKKKERDDSEEEDDSDGS